VTESLRGWRRTDSCGALWSEHGGGLALPASPRASFRGVVRNLPCEAERPADRRPRGGRSLRGPFAQPRTFFTTSCAACRISTPICSTVKIRRPSDFRTKSPMRASLCRSCLLRSPMCPPIATSVTLPVRMGPARRPRFPEWSGNRAAGGPSVTMEVTHMSLKPWITLIAVVSTVAFAGLAVAQQPTTPAPQPPAGMVERGTGVSMTNPATPDGQPIKTFSQPVVERPTGTSLTVPVGVDGQPLGQSTSFGQR
jgi:hypothetical protein